MYIISQLRDVHAKVQHDVFDKFISHYTVKDVVPPYLVDSWVTKHKDDVLQSMKTCINAHLICLKTSKLVMDRILSAHWHCHNPLTTIKL